MFATEIEVLKLIISCFEGIVHNRNPPCLALQPLKESANLTALIIHFYGIPRTGRAVHSYCSACVCSGYLIKNISERATLDRRHHFAGHSGPCA